MRRDIRFEANISEYNKQVLSLVSHRSESADFTCETIKMKANIPLSEYFIRTPYYTHYRFLNEYTGLSIIGYSRRQADLKIHDRNSGTYEQTLWALVGSALGFSSICIL